MTGLIYVTNRLWTEIRPADEEQIAQVGVGFTFLRNGRIANIRRKVERIKMRQWCIYTTELVVVNPVSQRGILLCQNIAHPISLLSIAGKALAQPSHTSHTDQSLLPKEPVRRRERTWHSGYDFTAIKIHEMSIGAYNFVGFWHCLANWSVKVHSES